MRWSRYSVFIIFYACLMHSGPMPRSIDSGTVNVRPQRPSCRTTSSGWIEEDGRRSRTLALFPRRVDGLYAMISRQDDENLFIMFSDNPHFWDDPQILVRPSENWQLSKIGNCGSPIETEAGWLLLTHGVGPMRKYCIGAVLLDLTDPTKVIGRLREPLLTPEEDERDGYVPNVIYTCGALRHGEELILPYAISDKLTIIASVKLEELLCALIRG